MPAIPPPLAGKAMPPISRPEDAPSSSTSSLPIIRRHKFPSPRIRLHMNDIEHEGSSIFLSNIKGAEDLGMQVQNVLNLLYLPDSTRPGTRSVTFVLHTFNGLAYTTDLDLDEDHKEIHLNLDYITKINPAPRDEILGVVCHELVHCFQWAAEGTCPGGLIEGIADWVRLRAGLGAKHWRQEASGDWKGGYQKTGYFLEYLEQCFGTGTVRSINEGLRVGKYNEEKLFASCCEGRKVEELWKEYSDELQTRQRDENLAQHSDVQPTTSEPSLKLLPPLPSSDSSEAPQSVL